MRGSTQMGPSGPLSMSYSQVSKYARCPKAYELSYLRPDVVPVVHGAGIAGSAIHRAIEVAESTGTWLIPYTEHDDEGLRRMHSVFAEDFNRRVEEAGGPDLITWGGKKSRDYPMGEEAQWWLRFGSVTMLKRYRTIRRRDAEAGTVVYGEDGSWVEARISTTLTTALGESLVTGQIDAAMFVSREGQLIIRDWKSGSNLGLDPLQLAFYAWLLERHTEGEVTVDVGELGWLRGTKPETQLRRYDIGAMKAVVPEMFQQFATGVASGYFPMHPNMLCTACYVRDACAYGSLLPQPEVRDEW